MPQRWRLGQRLLPLEQSDEKRRMLSVGRELREQLLDGNAVTKVIRVSRCEPRFVRRANAKPTANDPAQSVSVAHGSSTGGSVDPHT
jgi:hypothetical protein